MAGLNTTVRLIMRGYYPRNIQKTLIGIQIDKQIYTNVNELPKKYVFDVNDIVTFTHNTNTNLDVFHVDEIYNIEKLIRPNTDENAFIYGVLSGYSIFILGCFIIPYILDHLHK
jgi:hypothetical protein